MVHQKDPGKAFLAELSSRIAAAVSAAGGPLPSLSADLERAILDAFHLANGTGDDVGGPQLLAAMLPNPKVLSVMEECAINVSIIEADVPTPIEKRGFAARFFLRVLPMREVKASYELTVALAHAALMASESGRDSVGLIHVLLHLWDYCADTKRILKSAGGDKLSIRRYVSHGVTHFETHLPAGMDSDAEVFIQMHNDDFTTMEFVVQALTEIFAVPNADEIMRQIHKRERVVLGPFRLGDAVQRVERVHRAASRELFPLYATLVKKA